MKNKIIRSSEQLYGSNRRRQISDADSLISSEKAVTPPYSKTMLSLGMAISLAALSGVSAADDNAKSASLAGSKPNILYIVADDLGYSDISAFGGEISTPNLDALVKNGRILTNYHTSTVCAVTRAMLYSGTDHHLVGLGTMGAPNDERRGLPGYEGYLNNNALSIAELLKDGGYHTYIAGKWHLGSLINSNQNKTPDQWGFERSYTLLGGALGNHFGGITAQSRSFTENGQFITVPATDANGEPWYDTNAFTQKLISYIDENIGDGKPFAAFATYTSPHWPLQVPEPWLNQYAGQYDVGYDEIRNRRLLRQKQLGLVPNDYIHPSDPLPNTLTASAATPNNNTASASYINADTVQQGITENVDYGPGRVNPDWDSLTPEERKTQARYMEIYAGMVSHLDYNIGLLIQHLKDIGQYDNTFIVFHSDNGADGWPLSAAQERLNQQNFDSLGKDQRLRPAGTPATSVYYGLRWAEVGSTPFRLSKGFTTEGGHSVPTIVRLPGQTQQYPTLRTLFHISDSAPTLLELAGIPQPSTPSAVSGVNGQPLVSYKGRNVYPITGLSLLSHLETGSDLGPLKTDKDGKKQHGQGYLRDAKGKIEPLHTEPVGEEQYGRAYLYSGKWKAVWNEPPYGPIDGHWQLYDIEKDRAETNDLSAEHPDVVAELYQAWKDYLYASGGVNPKRPRGYY
ncbi:arylsulfatase [Methylicorpusculum oleiharenae]|uniref:arylsulfatase n=1 Tax=Methylicorpusculum oleiharenae TaxID=1338687 RepID=UPI0019D06DCD|nr:arylsulfatase [Methylicorpusculum oleiharenae]MCD2450480.1 arylsulfatase [Methylicorpusculum oleiharenae]